jgi:hypothetical protein
MTTQSKWSAPTLSTVISTALNSITHQATAASSTIDNTTTRYMYADIEVFLNFSSGTPISTAMCMLEFQEEVDGSNVDAGFTDTETPLLAINIPIGQAAATAQRVVARQIPIPPAQFIVVFANETGLTLPASGNTVKFLYYGFNLNG